jgi:uncharacterized protein (TIGR00369 family)
MVQLIVPSALRSEAEGASHLEISSTGTLRAVLDEVESRWPRLGRRIRDEQGELRRYVNVYINGEDCRNLAGQESAVAEGAEVQVIPSVAGGSDFDGNAILAEHFAPWVQELGLVVEEAGADYATLRLPWSARLAREGGAISGQALMAAADTATVIAIASARGGFGPMTTVQLSATFQRPVIEHDVLVTSRLTKLGRSLAFADVTMVLDSAESAALVAHATTVYAVG